MLKYLFLSLLFVTSIYAEMKSVDYRIEFGIVGEVGRVHTEYTSTAKSYMIDTHVKAVGTLAKTVTRNLKEEHICKGIIRKGKRIATSYEMKKTFGEYKTNTLYMVNHKTKKLTKEFSEWTKNEHGKYKLSYHYKDRLGYVSDDDMVTLFLNLSYKIKDKFTPKHYTFRAIGADIKRGIVDINIPTKKEAKQMQKLLGKPNRGEWLMNFVMHRKLYGSKKGELMVRMGKDSTIEKAVLKDLLFFGDVRIIRK